MPLPVWPITVPSCPIMGTQQVEQTSAAPLVSEMNAGTTRRRRQYTRRIAAVRFELKMDAEQLSAFQTFYLDDLDHGAERFDVPVYFGQTAAVHTALFSEPPSYTPSGRYWLVQVSLLVEDLTPALVA